MITGEERYICNQQKELYEYAQSKRANIEKFSDAFMNSDFCNRSLDKPYSVDQFADIVNWLEFLEKDCPVVPDVFQSRRVSFETAGWIGFIYRYLHFETGLTSKELSARIPVEKLIIAYPGLHTIDEDMAAEIIAHDFNIPIIEKRRGSN